MYYRLLRDKHSITAEATRSWQFATRQNPAPLSQKEPRSKPIPTENTPTIGYNSPTQRQALKVAEPPPSTTPYAIRASWVSIYENLEKEIALRHYSPKTLKAYQQWVRKFQGFLKSKEPNALSQQDVKDFLSFLALEKKVAASTQNQALNALLFLYRHVLNMKFDTLDGVARAKKSLYIPAVLSRAEIDLVISCLDPPYNLATQLLYGCGLRLSECLNLRLQDFNFDTNMLTIHNGKGSKDRTLPLPRSILGVIKQQFEHVIDLHEKDTAGKYAGVFLPDALSAKYPQAAKELGWQWFFPAKILTLIAETGENKRYHLHDTHLQKAIKKAVKKSTLVKPATSHTFRHSFASHLLQANYDIHTIQIMMGHSDIRTTLIYLKTVPSITIKLAKSPLDFDTDAA